MKLSDGTSSFQPVFQSSTERENSKRTPNPEIVCRHQKHGMGSVGGSSQLSGTLKRRLALLIEGRYGRPTCVDLKGTSRFKG